MRTEMIRIITDIKDIPRITEEIGRIKSVKAVYLFGSYASGKVGLLSDIDLCVITDKLTEKDELKIMGYASDNLDISMFNELPIYIKFRVFKDGKPLIVKDEDFLDLVKIKTLQEYWDFKPLLNKYVREVLGVENVQS